MTNHTYAVVTASPGFWGRLLMKKINAETSNRLTNDMMEEIVIANTNGQVLEDIVNISKEYPDELFWIKISGEDVFENYVYTYSCSNGSAELKKQGLEYFFGISKSDQKRLKEGLFEQFKRRITANYEALDLPILNNFNTTQVSITDPNVLKKEGKNIDAEISLVIKYKTKDVCLTATKYGKTFINVDVEFLNEPKKPAASEKDAQNKYEDLPF